MPRLIRFCCAVAVVFVSVCALGQTAKFNPGAPNATFIRDPQTYGTQAEIAYVIPAIVFNPSDSFMIWHSFGNNSGVKFVGNNNGCCLDGPMLLPSGAAITGIEVEVVISRPPDNSRDTLLSVRCRRLLVRTRRLFPAALAQRRVAHSFESIFRQP